MKGFAVGRARWFRPLLSLAILTAVFGGVGCGKKQAEEAPPPKPDAAGRMPMTNQGTVAQPGGGSGQVTSAVTDE